MANKFFFLNGGSETVFFQERSYLLNAGIKVLDFSMDHPNNYPSDYSQYFVTNVAYAKNGRLHTPLSELRKAFRFIHNREAIAKLQALIQHEKPDIAHLHNIYHQLTPSLISVLKRSGIKVVLTLHDYKLICPAYLMLTKEQLCDRCQGRHFWRATANSCRADSRLQSLLLTAESYWHWWLGSYGGVDLFLSPSRFLAEKVAACRVDPKKVRVLHNGIQTRSFAPSLCDDGYVLYFGRIAKEKGIEVLLKAHRIMRANGNAASDGCLPLKVAGRGPLLEKLKNEYPDVELLGYQEGDELKELISKASFVVVPSQWYENCSMTVLESMAWGKPVIASRIGGLPEQIDDGKTGLLFQMGNADELSTAMSFLARNSQLRADMGKAARARVERDYSLDAHCEKLVVLYEGLLREA